MNQYARNSEKDHQAGMATLHGEIGRTTTHRRSERVMLSPATTASELGRGTNWRLKPSHSGLGPVHMAGPRRYSHLQTIATHVAPWF